MFTACYERESERNDVLEIIYCENHGRDRERSESWEIRERAEIRDADRWHFERDGYDFVGWNTRRSGSGTDYEPGEEFKVKEAGTLKLYAQWEKCEDKCPGAGITPEDTGVSKLLETEEHIQYLRGYPDGTFGPGRNMTRAEACQMFYALLLNKTVPMTVSFTDVAAGQWYTDAVRTMASIGVVRGYPDGSFRPNKAITRAEFTAMAMQFAKLSKDGENRFSDVKANDWFFNVVVGASSYGWISGYPDGTFRPNANITRAEVTSIVNNMLGRFADEVYVDRNAEELNSFTDLNNSHWAYYAIMEATNEHDYTKDGLSEDWKDVNFR